MKKNIALITGGDSSEIVISLKSAAQVAGQLSKESYRTYIIVITGRDWYYESPEGVKYQVDKNDFSLSLPGEKISFEFAVIMIHGTPGEDGKLQGYFDMMGIPYSSCGVLAASLTFNKYYCKTYVANSGIKTARSLLLRRNDLIDEPDIANRVGLPCFVKPNNGGSSFGASKVNRQTELATAIEKAFNEDHEVIVEEFISGTEITCGLVKFSGREMIFPLTEIVSKTEFFDYEAKYTPGMAEEIIPARIPEELALKCREISSSLYDLLNCRGIVRIDYILKGEEFWFLEVNTVPGMSENSIVPRQIRAMELQMSDVMDMIIRFGQG
jgi:D-alanine-D-alanine ligase